jgi:hypothetical protein
MTWAGFLTSVLLMFQGANGVLLSTLIVGTAAFYSAASHHYGWLGGAIVSCGAAMAAANIAQTYIGAG